MDGFPLVITALYASLLTIVYLFLSLRIPPLRYKHKVGIGDGGADELARAVRVHANFIEYTPLAIILLGLSEVNGVPVSAIHALGLTFLGARLGHALALTRSTGGTKLRTLSMLLTFAVLAVLAGLLIWRVGLAFS